MNKNYKFGIMAASVTVILASVFAYVYWMYSPEAVYGRGLASSFWLSLEDEDNSVVVRQGETVQAPINLHHWKELDAALYVGVKKVDSYDYPAGLSVSSNIDRSVISLAKDSFAFHSFDRTIEPDEFYSMRVVEDGEMIAREVGTLTVSASEDVPPGEYYYELSVGDTAIHGHRGGVSGLLTIMVKSKG